MSTRDTYLLHIYRGRAVSGRQWAARVVHVSGGESLRFSDPEALLAHLRSVIGDIGQPVVGETTDAPATDAADQGTDAD